MPELEAFEPVTVDRAPFVTAYRGATYRSDQAYIDAEGRRWTYYGLRDGSSMWQADGSASAWNITAIVDQFGPLTPAEAGGDRG